MPASLILMQEEKINPTLGENALIGTIYAGVLSILLIIGLMRWMYGWRKALVTTGVLLSFVIALLGLMKLTSYALSLSGIAAIILSIGMGVDANVLIFERVREEAKAGKTIKSSIDIGYERSWAPIRDGNFSTAIIAALLFVLGINMFKGFGLMMLLNILLILALNLPLTRDLLHWVFHKKADYIKRSHLDTELDKREHKDK
ncbi:MAG: MMPL family transporter [bacterium]|nr:MMPL family transporter [bacterium]